MGRSREADGNHIYGAFGHDFVTRDNCRIMLTALTKAQWKRLKTAMKIEGAVVELENKYNTDLDDEGSRYEFRDAIVSLIEPFVSQNDYHTIKVILDGMASCGVLIKPLMSW